MKDKHIHIESHSQLLKNIYQQVEEKIEINKFHSNIKIGGKFIFYITSVFFSYLLLYSSIDSLAFILSYMVYGFFALLFAFNFAHDFSHNTIFKSKGLNNICFISIYTILGAHAQSWKKRHINSHHYAPNVEEYDSDLKISSLIRVIPNSNFHWFHRYQHFYAPLAYMTYSLFWIFVKDFYILFLNDEYTSQKNFKYVFNFFLQKLIYIGVVLVLPLFFSLQEWYVVLIGFLLMHLFQSLFLLFTFFMTHHVEGTEYPTTDKDGCINTSWLLNQVKSSNDMHPFSKISNFIFGGFNNHIAHHLFPNYHHIHYPKLNKILYNILIENNIKPNQTSYLGGIVSHLKLLKRRSVK